MNDKILITRNKNEQQQTNIIWGQQQFHCGKKLLHTFHSLVIRLGEFLHANICARTSMAKTVFSHWFPLWESVSNRLMRMALWNRHFNCMLRFMCRCVYLPTHTHIIRCVAVHNSCVCFFFSLFFLSLHRAFLMYSINTAKEFKKKRCEKNEENKIAQITIIDVFTVIGVDIIPCMCARHT